MIDLTPHAWQYTGMKENDIVTIEGVYERRTFWQWLTRQPKQVRPCVIVALAVRTLDNHFSGYCDNGNFKR